MSRWLIRALRWVLGGWFLVFGALFLAARFGLPLDLPSDGNARAAAFMAALRETAFIAELMYLGFFAGGLAMLLDRTAPLGLVLLGPFVVVIFFYHLVLTRNWPFGSFWMALFVALFWLYRGRLSALWSPVAGDGRQ